MSDEVQQGIPYTSEDPNVWELDTEKYLNRLYNELLGNTFDEEKGVWIKDPSKTRTMNELGASEFMQEINSRFSVHQQLSELSDADIKEIASRGAEIYADKMTDIVINGGSDNIWGIKPSIPVLESISQRLYDTLFILLSIARQGGMKRYREHSRNPFSRTPKQEEVVL